MVSMRSSRRQASVPRTLAFNPSNLSFEKKKAETVDTVSAFFGPSVEIRTRGLLNPIQARYQTSPHPDMQLSSEDLNILAHPFEKIKS